MRYSVTELLKEPTGSTRRYALEQTPVPMEDGREVLVRGWVRFTHTDKGIWVQGRVEAQLSDSCSRCLNEFVQRLDVDLEDQYYPTIDPLTGLPLPADLVKDGGFFLDPHHVLNLQELVRQSALAELPMKPLCQSNCLGLCPQCGVNLNLEQCQCPKEQVDPRWLPLRKLLPKVSQSFPET